MKNILNYREIGNRLRKERKRKNKTQCKVALDIHSSESALSRVENGENESLTLEYFVTLCNYYGVSISYILTGEKENDPDGHIRKILKFMSDEKKKTIKEFLENLLKFF